MSAKIPARPMEYPYTFVSKVVNFPYKAYYKHANWRFKWVAIGYLVCVPLFIKYSQALNSPGNQEKYRLVKEKEHKEHLEHIKHLK